MCACQKQPMIMKQKAIINLLTRNNSELDLKLYFEVFIDEHGKLMVKVHKEDRYFEFNSEFIYANKNSGVLSQN